MTNNSSPQNSPSMDEETVAFASKIFNLARSTTPEDAELLLEYVRAGVPVDLTNEDGNTLLMLSAYSGNRAAVRGLIDLGADVNRLNKRSQSIIAGALFKGEDAIVTDLKKAGAHLDLGHPTARETAAMFGRAHLLEADDA